MCDDNDTGDYTLISPNDPDYFIGTGYNTGNISWHSSCPDTGVRNEHLMAKMNEILCRISTIEQSLLKLFSMLSIPDESNQKG